jgi:hypothetical protein
LLNGTQVSVDQFPQRALDLYRTANLSAPNRATNILGMARSNSQLRLNLEAARLSRILIAQISSSNNSDPIFSEEANDFLAQKEALKNSANNNQFCLLSILVSMYIFLISIN